MKSKIVLVGILASILFISQFQYCSSTKSSSGSSIAKIPEPNEPMLLVAQKKFAQATQESLKAGHSIYIGQCTNCHGAKAVKSEPENEWVEIIDRMAVKAKLNASEKKQVLEYVLSAREYALK